MSRRTRAGATAGLAVVVVAALAVPAVAQTLPAVENVVHRDVELQTLVDGLHDATNIDVASDGRVFIAERTGRVRIWAQDGTLTEAGRVGVDSMAGQCDDCEGSTLDEGGLHGILLARDFDRSGQLYLYYSVPDSLDSPVTPPKHPDARGPQETEGKFRLSRFTLVGDTLDPASETTILENPAEWFHCCHYGGDMEWLADGTLLLSTGDDTISSLSGGYAPRDYTIGNEFNNADLTSQNPADRRGKMLRVDAADVDGDGSIVPADNPFAGDPAYDPLVYAVGFRSPYRFAVDPLSQAVITGNVGPDGRWPDPNRGPAAHEEIEVVPAGGGTNHGWPRCIANNTPYNDYDFTTNTNGPPLSCEGMTPAAFTYSYTPYPTTNTNVMIPAGVGSAVMAGVVYRPTGGALALPARLHDRLLWFEWSRDGVLTLPVDAGGDIVNDSVDDVGILADGLSNPIDMAVGPDGAVYLLEYGSGLYNGAGSSLHRFVCAGCRPDPGDYGGAPVAHTPALSGAVGSQPSSLAARGGAAALAAAVLSVLVAVRRRKQLV